MSKIHPKGKPFSRSTYIHYHCRCEGCTEANHAYRKRYYALRQGTIRKTGRP